MNYPYRYLPLISPTYRTFKRFINNKLYAGDNVWCPICSHSFKSWLNNQKYGSCPYCQSATRQRMTSLYLEERYNPHQLPVKLLYFAPNWGLEKYFRQQKQVYNCNTSDLYAPNVDFKSDITNLLFDERSFDLIVCSHVLEHVPDDTKAIAELFRVLRVGGIALIQVPYNCSAEYTDEDLSIVAPKERERRFSQFDHVRRYGRDIVERLQKPGFKVEAVDLTQSYTPEENRRLGLRNNTIFVCCKE